MVNLRKISKKQLLRGMNLALKNSRSLLNEAKFLVSNRYYNRAFALSTLSIEEAEKVVFLTMCYHKDRLVSNQKTLNKFWNFFTSHKAKVFFFEDHNGQQWKSLLYVRKRKHRDWTKEEFKAEIQPLIKARINIYSYLGKVNLQSIPDLKLKCLYVDIDKKTLNFYPPLKVPKKVTEGLVLCAEQEIIDASLLRDTFRRVKTDRTDILADNIIALTFRDFELRELSNLLLENP